MQQLYMPAAYFQKKILFIIVLLSIFAGGYAQTLSFSEFEPLTLQSVFIGFSHTQWVDYDNDGDLDIFYGYDNNIGILRNDGGDLFINVVISGNTVPNRYVWGDYDNDGDLDLFVGYKLFENMGDGTFMLYEIPVLLPKDVRGLDLGDVDHDGDLDLLCIQSDISSSDYSATIYYNVFGAFTASSFEIPTDYYANCKWLDFNQDGQLDIVINHQGSLSIYENRQNDYVELSTVDNVPSWGLGELKITDIDSDGDPDIIASGNLIINDYPDISISALDVNVNYLLEPGDFDNDGDVDLFRFMAYDFSSLFLNDGGSFSNSGLSFPYFNGQNENGDWGDYDKDGDLDLVVTFSDYDSVRVRIYKNDINIANTAPTPPPNLSSIVSGNTVSLSWDAGSDAQTISNALFYNLDVNLYGMNVVAPHADTTTGFLRKTFKGNVGQLLNYSLEKLKAGTYRWRIQSIDNGAEGSVFSSSATFEITYTSFIGPSDAQVLFPSFPGDLLTVNETGTFDSREWVYATKPGGAYTSLGFSDTTYIPDFFDPGEYYVTCRSFVDTDTVYSMNEVHISVLYFEEVDLGSFLGSDLRSVSIADFDNDDDYDILLGSDNSYYETKILENIGEGFNSSTSFFPPYLISSATTCFDYDNDSLIDFLITGLTDGGEYIADLYKNYGGFSFSPIIRFSEAGVRDGSVDHGDYNNDGLQDIIISGLDLNGEPLTKVFKNYGNDFFNDIQAELIPVSNGSVDFIDLNNDSYLDIFVSGIDLSGNPATEYYVNDKNGGFKHSGAALPDFENSTTDFGDYNNDGFYDVFISGKNFNGSFCYVLKNLDGYKFDQIEVANNNSPYNSGKWIDYDNDGDLDIILVNDNSIKTSFDTHPANLILDNIGGDQFSENIDFRNQLNFKSSSAIAVFQYDNDTDADIFQVGYDETTYQYKAVLLQNLQTLTKPGVATPSNLISSVQGDNIVFSWTDNTPAANPKVSFNISIGTWSEDIFSPHAGGNGFRKIAEYGEIHGTSWTIPNNLGIGEYMWKVQAIDNSLNASNFSFEEYFYVQETFSDLITPGIINVAAGGADWGDYDNDGYLDLAVSGDTTSFGNIAAKIYHTTDSGFYEIPAVLEGVFAYPSMFIEWIDIDNDNNLDLVLYGNTTTVSSTKVLNIYQNLGGDNFSIAYTYDVLGNSTACANYGDIDNDGDIDFVVSTGKILRNEGGFAFTEIVDLSLDGNYLDVVDIDNDMDFDIVSLDQYSSKILVNDGFGAFSELADLVPPLYTEGETKWFDYNNDSYIDLLITGSSDLYKVTKILTNNQDNTFSELNTILKGSNYGNVSFGDYDNDGDADFFINGRNSVIFTELYLNNESSFNNLGFNFPYDVYVGKSRMADMNNDGDLDIVSTGFDGVNNYTTIYENLKNWPNTPPSAPDSLKYKSIGFGVQLDWNKARDIESSRGGLSYNVRIGSTSGGYDIVSPQADIVSGFRKVAKIGNAQYNMSYKLDSLPVGTYYWSVQAIDHAFMGGAWAEEDSFIISSVTADFSADTVCLGLPTYFTDLSSSNGFPISNWDWDFGDGNTSSEQYPVHVFDAAGTFQVKLLVSYMIDGVKFPGDSITQSVSVTTAIIPDFTATDVCFGTATAFTNTSIPNGLTATSWYWDFDDGTQAFVENPGTNTYAWSGAFYVELGVIADNGCASSIVKTVQVGDYPDVFVYADGALEFCLGDSVTLSADYYSNYSYTWKLNDQLVSNGDSSDYQAKASGSFTVDVVDTYGGCSTTSDPIIVFTQAAPATQTIASSEATTFCEFDSTILSVPYNADYIYEWFLDEGWAGPDTNSLVAYYQGDYTLNVYNSIGCKTTASNTVTVTVNPIPPEPSVYINGWTDFCKGDSVEFTTDYDPAYDYQWKDGTTNIASATASNYYASTSGEYYVKVTNASSGCYNQSWPEVVTVAPTPSAPSISASGVTTFCYGDSVTFSVTDNANLEYYWLWDGGYTGYDTSTFVAFDPGTYSLEVMNSDFCNAYSTNSFTVTVKDPPEVPFVNVDGPYDFCLGDSVELIASPYDPLLTYQWKNGKNNISGATDLTYYASTTGNYILKISNSIGCSNETGPENINVYSNPTSPTFTVSGNTTFCEGDSVTLSVVSKTGLQYEWLLDGFDYEFGTDSIVIYWPGTYNLEVYNSDGCSALSTNTVALTVNDPPAAPFLNVNGSSDLCGGDSVELSVIFDPSLTYQWKDGENNITDAKSNSYYASKTGNYSLAVKDINGCSSRTWSEPVAVNPAPFAPTISAAGPISFCEGGSVELSILDNPDYYYQWWQNGGGGVGSDQSTFTAGVSGDYTVEAFSSNGCSTLSTNEISVQVNPYPLAPVIGNASSTSFCDNDSVYLSTSTFDPSLSYQWMNGDITIPNANTFGYYARTSGNYRLVLSTSASCASESQSIPVNVVPSPTKPTISLSGPEEFCNGGSVELSVPVEANSIYKWMNFGGAVGDQNTYTATTSGSITLEISNTSGCKVFPTNNSIVVTVNPAPPTPGVTVSGDLNFCSGDSTRLRVGESEGITYQWINGTTKISDANSSTYYAKASGDYKAEVTNTYGCSSQSSGESINVKPPPLQPTISYVGSSEICEGETVLLNAVSNPANVHEWLYNNNSVGSNSTSLIADESGTYNLRVTNDELCGVMAESPVVITIHPKPATPAVGRSGDLIFCGGDSTEFKVAEDASLNYQWINGITDIVNANSNVYYAKESGNYKLKVSNTFSCSKESASTQITVKEAPVRPKIIYSGATEFCEGNSIEMYVPKVEGNKYFWSRNSENMLTDTNRIIVSESGTYRLSVSNDLGCIALSTNSVPVTVNTYPQIPVIAASGDTTFCEGLSVELSVTNNPSLTYQWMDGETILTDATSSSYLATASGVFKLAISSGNDCPVETQSKEVVVSPYPELPLIVTENYAEGECVKLDSIEMYLNNPEADVTYEWLLDGEAIKGEKSSRIKGRIDEGIYRVKASINTCETLSDPVSIEFADMPPKPEIYAEGPTVWYLVCSDTTANDYKWYIDGEEIPGANDIIYVANQQLGKYEVSISDGGCYSISNPLWIPFGTGIVQDPWENLKIYPNPTPGLFTLEMDNQIMGELIIDIYNERGSKVINIKFLKETSHFITQIDLSAQPSAVYLIGLMLDEYRANRRLIVE
ncbi:FG-GAP-like repeat-containing protein [Bacteroidota bacterium]